MIKIHLKQAASYIRRSPFQALASISVLGLTFFVATIISILVFSSNRVLNYFETRPQIIAFIKNDADDGKINTLREKLNNDTRVKNIRIVTKAEALEIYKKATADNPLLGELVSPSIFPASIEFSVINLSLAKEVIEETKKEDIVESVGFTASLEGGSTLGDVVERLKTITFYIRAAGIGFVIFLGATSFFVLLVVISMRITTRREEVEILELMGASPGFIRTPIILEAIYYAMVGVVMGWSMAVVLILYTVPTIISYFKTIPILPTNALNFMEILMIILATELAAGILIALGGSLLALGRTAKKK
ncbi:hypothetical protein A3D00_05550 [Candidatus Woesebacteria bacterium RIFCSPHIGHO2_02_FULL_38_9]|uniref:Cell division protein FtsX n=1 Tax=Candidatus Woesebacteria bacterium RIFCSPHIGHO2_01_FULL_39_28 TaxID=1802496 RepID=A0A1F7YIL2_9BACT|nr:MAG: hypothetical protein A2627_05930 [Candidatus Woesebacteria bacterium RIFCSPHIGHO2_01_FULL_39_28]OGM32019.1 MAG: hypothetical protein A3D00_05550 [Candidatus Woesebacteria bacterium RIFCSPHIGHO2_02_FULL_38_9]OGM57126.1 MAG: hypothetical protein A3A50_00340 [Candidatus Woesebacteria bacterium RIFCSPLOWO2_01_FULL_38_20]